MEAEDKDVESDEEGGIRERGFDDDDDDDHIDANELTDMGPVPQRGRAQYPRAISDYGDRARLRTADYDSDESRAISEAGRGLRASQITARDRASSTGSSSISTPSSERKNPWGTRVQMVLWVNVLIVVPELDDRIIWDFCKKALAIPPAVTPMEQGINWRKACVECGKKVVQAMLKVGKVVIGEAVRALMLERGVDEPTAKAAVHEALVVPWREDLDTQATREKLLLVGSMVQYVVQTYQPPKANGAQIELFSHVRSSYSSPLVDCCRPVTEGLALASLRHITIGSGVYYDNKSSYIGGSGKSNMAISEDYAKEIIELEKKIQELRNGDYREQRALDEEILARVKNKKFGIPAAPTGNELDYQPYTEGLFD